MDDCLTLARQRTGIDVIILAVVSLHGEGWDACEVLRRAQETSAVPLVVLTARVRADRANRDHARRLGCAAFAAKPCTPAALVALLMRVASGERSIEQLSDAV